MVYPSIWHTNNLLSATVSSLDYPPPPTTSCCSLLHPSFASSFPTSSVLQRCLCLEKAGALRTKEKWWKEKRRLSWEEEGSRREMDRFFLLAWFQPSKLVYAAGFPAQLGSLCVHVCACVCLCECVCNHPCVQTALHVGFDWWKRSKGRRM